MPLLIRPSLAALPHYVAALQRGWSADTVRGEAAAREELAHIEEDARAFIDGLDDPLAAGPPITLGDGSRVPRLPSLRRWMWDEGRFCGSIGLRWPGDLGALPPYVPGHIGYAVVPWERRRGLATRALGEMLHEARRIGLDHVELTTDPDNLASQRVVLRNGGRFIEAFVKPAAQKGALGWRYRIELGAATVPA